MSNAIYKKDLHDVALAVAQGSKNYTDNSIEKLKWELGTYDLSVETINGATMLLPTPANTIQATMDKIYGASEVSENLIVLQDVAETTTNGITYSVSNGVITLNGTATGWVSITLFSGSLSGTYTFKDFGSGTSTASNNIRIAESGSYTKFIPISNVSTATDITAIQFYCETNTTLTNVVIKPMLIKGSTAPTEFSVGFDNIHNLELSGLVVKNSDDEVMQTLPIDLTSIEDSGGNKLFEDGSLKGVGTAKDYITPYKAIKRIDSRSYQSGDEEDTSVLTDGTTTLYPLATPIEADIDLSQFVKFEAHSNGSITLVNTNNQDTTSTFKYLKEVAK